MTKTITSKNQNIAIQRASVAAGIGLLVMAVLAGYANFGVIKQLVVEGDAVQTASNITASSHIFIAGVVSFLLVAVLDIVVALAIYKVVAPVNKTVSQVAAALRIVYALVFVIATSKLIEASASLHKDSVHNAAEAQQNINSFNNVWDAALILFGVHLLLVGYLLYRAAYAPKFLGVLLVISGIGYMVDSFGSLLISNYSANIANVTFIGEVILIFWLLIRGRRIKAV
jgi:hypothetical protein